MGQKVRNSVCKHFFEKVPHLESNPGLWIGRANYRDLSEISRKTLKIRPKLVEIGEKL